MPAEIQVTFYLQAPEIVVTFPRAVTFGSEGGGGGGVTSVMGETGAVTAVDYIVFRRLTDGVADGALVKMELIRNEAGNTEPLFTEL